MSNTLRRIRYGGNHYHKGMPDYENYGKKSVKHLCQWKWINWRCKCTYCETGHNHKYTKVEKSFKEQVNELSE